MGRECAGGKHRKEATRDGGMSFKEEDGWNSGKTLST